MSVQTSTLVLVTSGLRRRALGIASGCCENIFEVNVIHPAESKAEGITQFPAQNLWLIAEDVRAEDVSEKMAPILLKLAERSFCDSLMFETSNKMLKTLIEARQ